MIPPSAVELRKHANPSVPESPHIVLDEPRHLVGKVGDVPEGRLGRDTKVIGNVFLR